MEKSMAIKCPDVYSQIANFKYFQYLINKKETWLRFNFTEEQYNASRKGFCDILMIQDFANDKKKILDFLEENGGLSAWVLKPQKEGGNHNYFHEQIKKKIEEFSLHELKSYILMKKINSM